MKSAYALLDCQLNGTMDGGFSLLWQTKTFPKVITTACRILLERLPTTHNLIRRGVVVNSPFMCFVQPFRRICPTFVSRLCLSTTCLVSLFQVDRHLDGTKQGLEEAFCELSFSLHVW